MMPKACALWWIARLGYWARGSVYLSVGGLATWSALNGTRPPSLRSAFAAIAELPFGPAVLLAIAAGLFGHALWRLVQAVGDLHGKGSDLGGRLARGGMLAAALLYAGLGLVAMAVMLDWGVLSGWRHASLPERWAALFLGWPLGRWLVATVGVGTAGTGAAQAARMRGEAFRDVEASPPTLRLVRALGRIGLAAKGCVLGLTGFLFLLAAWDAKAGEAGGLRDALRALGAAPLGDWLFFAIAAGLAALGLFNLLKGLFHKRP
jgi:hypothetical protein